MVYIRQWSMPFIKNGGKSVIKCGNKSDDLSFVQVFMRMITGIMWCSPIGISSVICAKILGVANLGRYAKILG